MSIKNFSAIVKVNFFVVRLMCRFVSKEAQCVCHVTPVLGEKDVTIQGSP